MEPSRVSRQGLGFVVDPPDGKIPYQPWALEQRQKNYEGTKTLDPTEHSDPLAKCFLPGIPRLTYLGWPFQIVQTPEHVGFYYEFSHRQRFARARRLAAPVTGR